jgi:hypothetical protein
MDKQIICLDEYRARQNQPISDQEVLRLSEEVGHAAVALVRQFAERYPDLPDTFFAFLMNQQLLSTACSGAESGHEGSMRLLSHAMNLLEVYEAYLNGKGTSFKTPPAERQGSPASTTTGHPTGTQIH